MIEIAGRGADVALRFDHLGMVVKSLAKGRRALASGLMIREWTQEFRDEINGVNIQFGRDPAGVVYELLEPLGESSPVFSALKSRKNLLNHVAYCVVYLKPHRERLEDAGYVAVSDPRPAIAYEGRHIQFFVSPIGLIVELIEALDHKHIYHLDAALHNFT
jgi:methylmalonyl-CoA/ethylmalonyl-CoA epimerase